MMLSLIPSSYLAFALPTARIVEGTGYTQPPGLVGYWKFDEGSGTSAHDSSLNGNNGVLIGSPTWTTGKSGYALTFDGAINNYVDCGNAASLHVQSYTLAAWIKPSAIRDSEHRIISNGGWANTNGAVDFVIAANGRLVVLNQDGNGQDECWSQSDSLLAVGRWSFVAATYDATNKNVKLYVDGVEVSTTLNTLRVPNPNPSWNMHIGVIGNPLNMAFKGSIDEVKIYNRALSAEEIGAEYTRTYALPAPILSSYNEVTGEIIEVTGPAGAVPANTNVQLYWDTTTGAWDGAKGLMNSTTADASGAYQVWFWVPEATFGTHQVWVKDAAGDTASTAFTMKTDNENVPRSGVPGDTITGTFYGFHATKNLAAILSTVNPPVSTAVTSEELTTPNGVAKAFIGTFAHRYLVPRTILFRTNGVEQAHDDGMGNIVDSGGPLTASGTIDYVTGAYTIIFTTAPPALPMGLGTDYSYWDTSSAPGSTQFDLGTGVTNSVGTAIITWKVPANVAISRTYNVLALESGCGLNNVDFRIMGIQLSSSSGPTGETITITGNGFSPNEAWNASIGSKTLGTGTISAAGLLQGGSGLLVPYGLSPGTYTITVLDIDSDAETTAQFTVTYSTTITVTPSSAPNGFNVTISGKGFSYLATGPADLSFTLYNKTTTGVAHIWTMDVEQNWPAGGPYTATVNGTGIVRAYWIVPDSATIRTGTYYINATDADGYSGQATFNVLAKHVVATLRNATFAVGDTISFQLEDTYKTAPVDGSMIKIYDPSGSLIFSGDTLDAAKWIKTGLWYTLPYSAQTASGNPMVIPDGAPLGTWSYKWVGTDNKNIATGTFTVTRARVETAYRSLQPTVNSTINSANYSSPDAKALLNQAQSAYQQATTLANQGKFQDAITDLDSASDFLSRAQTTENTYQTAYTSYQSLLQSVQTKLNQATGAGYKNPDAQSLLSQAQTYYSQATNSANSGQLQDANSNLTSASNLLDQAAAAEKSYVPNPATLGGNPQLWYVVIIGVVIIIVAALVIIRRGKSSKPEVLVKS